LSTREVPFPGTSKICGVRVMIADLFHAGLAWLSLMRS